MNEDPDPLPVTGECIVYYGDEVRLRVKQGRALLLEAPIGHRDALSLAADLIAHTLLATKPPRNEEDHDDVAAA